MSLPHFHQKVLIRPNFAILLFTQNQDKFYAVYYKALLHESGLTKKAKFCIFDFTTKQTYKP